MTWAGFAIFSVSHAWILQQPMQVFCWTIRPSQ
jgi:hypothetical protein